MNTNDEILYSIADGIGTITLNRPQQRNALTFAMYERIGQIVSDLPGHGDPRVLILTGAGEKAFAAGTDISQFRNFSTPQDALDYEKRIERIISAVESCPIPTIAAISGAVTGGGAGIAAVCDMRIATLNARFGFPIARTLGNCLAMGNYARLVALLGPARTKDILFTARLVDAEEGKALGLYNEIVADHTGLMERTHALARTIAGHAPLTLRVSKEAINRIGKATPLPPGEDLVLTCYMSEDFREGMDAFLTKRPPQWKGR